jgi:hypothetical protein
MNSIRTGGDAQPNGELDLQRTRDLGVLQGMPIKPGLRWHLTNWLRYRRRDMPKVLATRFLGQLPGLCTYEARLYATVYRAPWASLAPWQVAKLRALLAENALVFELPRFFGGELCHYGLLSTRVVTTAGVNFIVDAFQNTTELENLKFHGFGTGTNSEASGDTALQTEETTQYATDNTRPTGSTTEGASANIYRTVATYSPDSGGTRAITEHGVFSQAATGGGTLLDRSVFSAVNLVAGSDSLQTTYDLTFTAGS